MFEVIQEALVLPLFFLIGKTISNEEETKNKVKTGIITIFSIIFIFCLIMYIFAEPIVVGMAQDSGLVTETVSYIRLELIGILFSNIVKFLMVLFVLKELNMDIYIVLVIQMVLTIVLDSLFISELSVSLNLGVNGIAFTNIIVNFVIFIYMMSRTKHIYSIKWKDYFSDLNYKWQKEWIKVGGFSGIESFVRNFAFMIMIIRMINVVNEQGTFWIANTFIWNWMLIPVLTLGELIKKETSEGNNQIQNNTKSYFIVTTIIVISWLLTIPLWKPFLFNVMNVTDSTKVFNLVLIQLIFYIIFAYNNIMDSTFYGVGRTDYMLWQSLIVNILFYGCAFILFKTGVFVPTLNGIAIMFGLWMVFDFLPTLYLYIKLFKDRQLKIK